jgi:polar amino acid transport system substrate-binding protein
MFKVLGCLIYFFLCAEVLAVATYRTCTDYTPFVLEQDGSKNWRGRNAQVLFELTQMLSIEIDFSQRTTFVRCLKMLEKGSVDILSGLVLTPERNELFHMVPYAYRQPLALFYLKSHKPENLNKPFTSMQSIGVPHQFSVPDRIKQEAQDGSFLEVDSTLVAFQMMAIGRLDGAFASFRTGQAILSENQALADVIEYSEVTDIDQERIYFGLNRNAKGHELAEKLEELIVEPKVKQKIMTILNKPID